MAKAPVDPLAHVPASISGGAGGAVAGLGQFVGMTLPDTLSNLFAGELSLAMTQIASFLIGTVMMAIAGAVVAFFLQSKTQSRWALFLAGAAAISIGTTALPGFARLVKRVDLAHLKIIVTLSLSLIKLMTRIDLSVLLWTRRRRAMSFIQSLLVRNQLLLKKPRKYKRGCSTLTSSPALLFLDEHSSQKLILISVVRVAKRLTRF